jgi:hypothetical protein
MNEGLYMRASRFHEMIHKFMFSIYETCRDIEEYKSDPFEAFQLVDAIMGSFYDRLEKELPTEKADPKHMAMEAVMMPMPHISSEDFGSNVDVLARKQQEMDKDKEPETESELFASPVEDPNEPAALGAPSWTDSELFASPADDPNVPLRTESESETPVIPTEDQLRRETSLDYAWNE